MSLFSKTAIKYITCSLLFSINSCLLNVLCSPMFIRGTSHKAQYIHATSSTASLNRLPALYWARYDSTYQYKSSFWKPLVRLPVHAGSLLHASRCRCRHCLVFSQLKLLQNVLYGFGYYPLAKPTQDNAGEHQLLAELDQTLPGQLCSLLHRCCTGSAAATGCCHVLAPHSPEMLKAVT